MTEVPPPTNVQRDLGTLQNGMQAGLGHVRNVLNKAHDAGAPAKHPVLDQQLLAELQNAGMLQGPQAMDALKQAISGADPDDPMGGLSEALTLTMNGVMFASTLGTMIMSQRAKTTERTSMQVQEAAKEAAAASKAAATNELEAKRWQTLYDCFAKQVPTPADQYQPVIDPPPVIQPDPATAQPNTPSLVPDQPTIVTAEPAVAAPSSPVGTDFYDGQTGAPLFDVGPDGEVVPFKFNPWTGESLMGDADAVTSQLTPVQQWQLDPRLGLNGQTVASADTNATFVKPPASPTQKLTRQLGQEGVELGEAIDAEQTLIAGVESGSHRSATHKLPLQATAHPRQDNLVEGAVRHLAGAPPGQPLAPHHTKTALRQVQQAMVAANEGDLLGVVQHLRLDGIGAPPMPMPGQIPHVANLSQVPGMSPANPPSASNLAHLTHLGQQHPNFAIPPQAMGKYGQMGAPVSNTQSGSHAATVVRELGSVTHVL